MHGAGLKIIIHIWNVCELTCSMQDGAEIHDNWYMWTSLSMWLSILIRNKAKQMVCALCVLVEIRRNNITLSGTGTNMFVLKQLKCQTINITSNIDCNKSKTRGEFRNFVSIYERGIEKNIKLLVNHSLE